MKIHGIRWLFAASILIFAMGVGSASARETHTLLLRCGAGGVVGVRNGEAFETALGLPEDFPDADGHRWTLAGLTGLEGFQLEAAFLRMRITETGGQKLKYAAAAGPDENQETFDGIRGDRICEFTGTAGAWLSSLPGEEPRLKAAHRKRNGWIRIEEGSVRLQLTFSTEEEGLRFPLDRVQEETLLDCSMCYLEEANPVLRRYREETGTLMTSRFPLGVPYYFGGVNEEKILHRYFPRQVTGYYRADRMYLCGLDCAGFINLALRNSGLEPIVISEVLKEKQDAELLNRRNPRYWSTFLLPGDLVAMKHGKFKHVMIFLGTLRSFGWTEETAGEAAPVLDMPLVIHCGENPFCYLRYQAYIEEQGFENTYPPDGGVTVSVVTPGTKDAPRHGDSAWGDTFSWYLLEGQPLLVFSLENCTDLTWHLPR